LEDKPPSPITISIETWGGAVILESPRHIGVSVLYRRWYEGPPERLNWRANAGLFKRMPAGRAV
jgi:hypothetical protein